MPSRPLTFRLDDSEIPLLESHAIEGESHQLTAQRIVRERIGSPAQGQLPADWKDRLMPEIRAMIEQILAEREAGQLAGNESRSTEKPGQIAPQSDLNELADRTLASLKLGAQSPSYKASKKAIEKFIQYLQAN